MVWFRDIAKNTIYQIIARVVTSGTTFLITIVITRHFGQIAYGDFAKVTALVTLFYLIADFGLNAVFLQREDSRLHFKDLFYPRLILSLILVVIVNIIALFLPYDPTTNIGFSPLVKLGIFIFSFTIVTESILITSTAIFQRDLTYKFFMLAGVMGSVVSLLLVSFAAIFSYPLPVIFVAFLLGGIAESATALFLTKEVILPISFDASFIKKLAHETLPIMLMLFFNLVYFRIDMILLSLMRPSSDVAIYDFSYKIFDFLIALPLFLSNSLYLTILNDVKNNRKVTKAKEYVLFFILAAFIIVIPVWLITPFLSPITPLFALSTTSLRILLVSLPLFFGTSILQWVLIAEKKQSFLAWVYLFSTILNIILNLLLIPSYGYIGSAIITGISEVIVFLLLWFKLFPLKKTHAI